MFKQHTLYIDNFRGFSDTYVPLTDVNFLVGENSTGKTSLLSLLKLMSAERLLLENQFSVGDVDLGTFRDIVSAHTSDPSYFRIGLMRREGKIAGALPLGMLVTYREHEGLPRDTHFTCTFESKEIAVKRVGNEIHFRLRDDVVHSDSDMKRIFKGWLREQSQPTQPGDGFRKLDFPYSEDHSLLFPLSLLASGTPLMKRGSRLQLVDPAVFPPLTWVAPIRTKPRRTYDELRRGFSPEGTHTPYLIRKILESGEEAKKFLRIIQRTGQDSGLFRSIEIKKFGSDATGPFEVRVFLDDESFNLTNVGYGVSQALPVLVEILWRPKNSWMAIQQPEVHMHPRAQAALGGLIFAMARAEKKKFLIETHSDFLIDRFRSSLKANSSAKLGSQVLFFERRNQRNTVVPLRIGMNGEMPAKQPRSYRSFFLREALRVLDI